MIYYKIRMWQVFMFSTGSPQVVCAPSQCPDSGDERGCQFTGRLLQKTSMGKNTSNIHCYAWSPFQQYLYNYLFSIVPLCFVFYGPSLLSNMSGRKHLRCSLGLFAAPSSNHLAKLWHRNSPQIGPFLGQSSLFVCLPPSYPDQCWPFIGILWQAEKNWVTQSRSQSFIFSSFILV